MQAQTKNYTFSSSAPFQAGGPAVSSQTLIPSSAPGHRPCRHRLSPRQAPRVGVSHRLVYPYTARTAIRYNPLVPTVLRTGPYRFYFYSHEPNEPAHVHVDRDELSAKFWIAPVALARNFGFTTVELRKVQSLVEDHQRHLLEEWNGHFGFES
jgi:hypothetical protein